MLEVLKSFSVPDWFILHSHSYLELVFMPHGTCYLWKPDLVLLHVVSDALIALAYYSIPLTLVYFIHQRRDVPFPWIFVLFGIFIVSCGTTHMMEVWTLWYPSFWLSGSIKAVTAIASCYTAAELVGVIPQALALPSPSQLATANQKLAEEVRERQLAEAALRESEIRFRSIFEGAAIGISLGDIEGRALATNPALERMLGYSGDELQGMELTKMLHPEDTADSWQLYQELVAGHLDYYQTQKRYIHKHGHLVWVRLTVSLVRDAGSQPQYSIGMMEDITERKGTQEALQRYQEQLEEMVGERTVELTKANEQLSWQANHDELTGCANRYAFEQCLEEAVVSAKNLHQEHTLCYLDLDRFKIVNDTCGHVAGDELLRQLSGLLKTNCRRTDTVARLGGDEFCLLLYRCSLEQGMRVAQSLLENMQAFRFVWQDKIFSLGFSIGMVAINAESQSPDSVLGAADAACYIAKNNGRNRIHVYQANDQDLAKARNEVQWVARINQAMARSSEATPLTPENRFCLYYQPIASLSANSATREHYEVLLRLVNEKGELILPMAFLPAAERYNLMPAIDKWVVSTFFGHLSRIIARTSLTKNNGQLTTDNQQSLYALNLSGASVNDDQFVNFLKEQFQLYQIPPQLICFEITETVAITNLSKAAQLIQELKALGCHFTLDDFGSSMSSFAYLKYLPVEYMKIDGAFVKEMADNPIHCAMVEAINRIGHVVGLQTIAECVADDSILEKVKNLGVDYAQGYRIGTPQPLLD